MYEKNDLLFYKISKEYITTMYMPKQRKGETSQNTLCGVNTTFKTFVWTILSFAFWKISFTNHDWAKYSIITRICYPFTFNSVYGLLCNQRETNALQYHWPLTKRHWSTLSGPVYQCVVNVSVLLVRWCIWFINL